MLVRRGGGEEMTSLDLMALSSCNHKERIDINKRGVLLGSAWHQTARVEIKEPFKARLAQSIWNREIGYFSGLSSGWLVGRRLLTAFDLPEPECRVCLHSEPSKLKDFWEITFTASWVRLSKHTDWSNAQNQEWHSKRHWLLLAYNYEVTHNLSRSLPPFSYCGLFKHDASLVSSCYVWRSLKEVSDA